MTTPSVAAERPPSTRGKSRVPALLRALARRKLALFGLAVIAVMVLLAAAAPLVAPYPYDQQLADGISLDGAPLPPDMKYLLGTDLLGRDLLSRLIYGARTSLVIGVVANGASVMIGSFAVAQGDRSRRERFVP